MNAARGRFSNSDMSYDTKAQKNRAQLENGAALSTLLFVDDDEDEDVEPAADTERAPAQSPAAAE